MSFSPAVRSFLLMSLTAVFVLAVGLTHGSVPASGNDYLSDLRAWRGEVEEKLKADDGWLTIAGLFWLTEGEHQFGSGDDNDIVLPKTAPETVGTFTVNDGVVSVVVDAGVQVTMGGKPIRSATLERGPKNALSVGVLDLWLHGSGERRAIRLRDPSSWLLAEFTGLKWFPVDEAFRVDARFMPYAVPKDVEILNVFGDVVSMKSPGELQFEVKGQAITLQPFSGRDGSLFIIFRDETSGKESYGAGRFMQAGAPQGGHVELDFNRAYNPPCAYNPHTTCPLPPKKNNLSIRIEAGEMAYKKSPT